MRRGEHELEEYARARLVAMNGGQEPAPSRFLGDVDGVSDVEPRSQLPGATAVRGSGPADIDSVRERATAFLRGHVAAVLVVLLLAGVATAGFLARAQSSSVPLPTGSAAPGGGAASEAATAAAFPTPVASGASVVASSPAGGMAPAPAPAARLRVHVLGEVRRPGVVQLAPGSCVQDAVDRAGGLTPSAAPGELNLAAPLADGDQVVIGGRRRPGGRLRHAGDIDQTASGGLASVGPGAGQSAGVRTSTATSTGLVDLNTATVEQLDQLPGVGPVTAQKILDWRGQHQRFSRVDELQEVDGIGPKSFERIKPHVRV